MGLTMDHVEDERAAIDQQLRQLKSDRKQLKSNALELKASENDFGRAVSESYKSRHNKSSWKSSHHVYMMADPSNKFEHITYKRTW